MLNTVFLGGDDLDLTRILIAVPLLYVVVIAFVRISGKRSASQMNNFDWIVTVAMGSLVGSGIILRDVGLIEAALAVGLLLACQFALTWSVIRSDRLSSLVKASPRLLVCHGKILHDALRDERVSEQELMASIRGEGLPNLEDVTAVILETDATMTVMPAFSPGVKVRSLDDIRDYDPQ